MTVGSQDATTIWHLPKALLSHQSPFFAAALNGSFAEAKWKSVTMPDDDPDVFKTWIQWLFVAEISCESDFVLVKAWILGDKLGCLEFQNRVMTNLLDSHSPWNIYHMVKPSTVRVAYEGSAPGSKLRKWAIDFFLYQTSCNKSARSPLQQNNDWVSQTKDIEGFSQDYMETCVGCSLEGEPANPWFATNQYMVD